MTADLSVFTPREAEITKLLLDGWRVPKIAEHLGRSESTVRNHLSSAYRRVGVDSQQMLIDLMKAPGVATLVPGNSATCAAESGVEIWEDDDAAQDVRCHRSPGHDGKHAGVVRWESR